MLWEYLSRRIFIDLKYRFKKRGKLITKPYIKESRNEKKLNRNQKRITLLDIQLSSLTSLFVMNVKWLLNQQCIKIQLSQKHFFGKILNSMIKNMGFEPWKYCTPRRNRLLARTTKQQLRPKNLKILATLLAEAWP